MRNSDSDFLWIHLLVSGVFLVIGLHIWINPPKDMDIPTGLNLPISINPKLNIDVWTEFHRYAGKIMSIVSLIPLVLGVCLNLILPIEQLSSTKLTGLNLALLLVTSYFIVITTMIMMETHMTKTFDKKGNRKENDLNS